MLRSIFFEAAALLASLQVLSAQAVTGTFERTISTSNESPSNIIDINASVLNNADATAWSIIFTDAMIQNANVISSIVQQVSMNEFLHIREFPTPEANAFIAPNLDVLYSFGILDLAQTDVVLTIPEIDPTRFWSFVIYDLYGNAVGEISNVQGHQAGEYRVLRDYEQPVGLFDSDSSDYQKTVRVSTAVALVAARVGILDVTADDLAILQSYQDGMALDSTLLTSTTDIPTWSNMSIPGSVVGVEEQFSVAARLSPYNPPQTISDRDRVSGFLAQAGISNGTYVPQPDVDMEEVSVVADRSTMASYLDPENKVQLGADWTIPKPAFQGNFGTNYGSLAEEALYYLQTQELALYPNSTVTSDVLNFNDSSLLLTFSGKPRVDGPGFWNIGSYDESLQLVPNGLDRYAIGSKTTSIVYVDGGLVFGPNATSDDEVFQILMQNTNIPPPSNWTGNWLPVAEFGRISFRIYGPADAM